MTIDIVPGVPLETRLTTAHGGVRPVSRGIIIHATRGPTHAEAGESLVDTLDREYHVAVAYMLNPANEVSPHFCVGSKIVARMVHDDAVAWHAQEHNQTHLGIEVAQPAYQPEFADFEYEAAGEICAHWCVKYAIPPVRVMDDNLPGIIGHEQTDQGRRDGKSDPGWRWDWPRFIFIVQEKVRQFGMTNQEKTQCGHIADVVEQSNAAIAAKLAALEALVGEMPFAADIRALQLQIHNHAVHNLRVVAGIEPGVIVP